MGSILDAFDDVSAFTVVLGGLLGSAAFDKSPVSNDIDILGIANHSAKGTPEEESGCVDGREGA